MGPSLDSAMHRRQTPAVPAAESRVYLIGPSNVSARRRRSAAIIDRSGATVTS